MPMYVLSRSRVEVDRGRSGRAARPSGRGTRTGARISFVSTQGDCREWQLARATALGARGDGLFFVLLLV